MAPKKAFERQIFQMNFGYRSLIDWSDSGGWKRGGKSRGSMAKPPFGTLAGPVSFTAQQRPRTNLWGKKESSAYIPGFTGFYYDVHKAEPDNFSKNVEGMLNELSANSQQWLYLAAEFMAAKGTKLVNQNKVKQEEIDRIMALTSGTMEGDRNMDVLEQQLLYDDPDRFTGRGKYKAKEMSEVNPEKERKNLEKFTNADDPAMQDMGATMSQPYGVWPTSFGRAGATYSKKTGKQIQPSLLQTFGSENIGQPAPTTDAEGTVTQGEQQFRNMLTGVQGQWINAYASNVIERGDPKQIERLAKTVEDHVADNVEKYGGTLDYGDEVQYFAKGERPSTNIEGEGGQTTAEFAAIKSGIATGKYGVGGASLAIDVKFNKDVILKAGVKGAKSFKRADLTTEFFRETLHHGVGYSANVGGAEKSVEENEKAISIYYQGRIKDYNTLINFILKATRQESNPKGVYDARQKWSKMTMKKSKGGEGKSLKQIAKDIDYTFKQGVYEIGSNLLEEDLEWVLHHMGNMLPGGVFDPDPYANTMPIRVAGGVGTLFVVFDIDPSTGLYRNMDTDITDGIDGSYVHISTDEPMRWLFNKAHHEGWVGTIEQFADMGSFAMVENGLIQNVQSGQLFSLQYPKFMQRLVYSKLGVPQVDDTLKKVSSKLFETIGDNIGESLDEQLHDDAVKFSVQTRNPSQLKEIKKWYDFAADYLLTRDAALGGESDLKKWAQREYPSSEPFAGYEAWERRDKGRADAIKMWEGFGIEKENRSDPFWYLWAAPYVTRTRAGRIGGALTGYIAK